MQSRFKIKIYKHRDIFYIINLLITKTVFDPVSSPNGEEFSCACPQGFSGKNCEETPCYGVECQNGAECIVDGASFKCSCQDGFLGQLCEGMT